MVGAHGVRHAPQRLLDQPCPGGPVAAEPQQQAPVAEDSHGVRVVVAEEMPVAVGDRVRQLGGLGEIAVRAQEGGVVGLDHQSHRMADALEVPAPFDEAAQQVGGGGDIARTAKAQRLVVQGGQGLRMVIAHGPAVQQGVDALERGGVLVAAQQAQRAGVS